MMVELSGDQNLFFFSALESDIGCKISDRTFCKVEGLQSNQ